MTLENFVLVFGATICLGILMFIGYVFVAWRHQPTCIICGDAVPYERKFCGGECYKQWLYNKKENAAG